MIINHYNVENKHALCGYITSTKGDCKDIRNILNTPKYERNPFNLTKSFFHHFPQKNSTLLTYRMHKTTQPRLRQGANPRQVYTHDKGEAPTRGKAKPGIWARGQPSTRVNQRFRRRASPRQA